MRSVRERIKINGKPISQEQFILHAKETWKQITGEELSEETITKAMQQPIVKRNKKTGKEASYFSFLTMIALNAFRWNQCHWAIIEVGIGGRYDFTNCISPVATAITPLGYDHMHMLGNTIEEIAWQKAGIFKVPKWRKLSEDASTDLRSGWYTCFYCTASSTSNGGSGKGSQAEKGMHKLNLNFFRALSKSF